MLLAISYQTASPNWLKFEEGEHQGLVLAMKYIRLFHCCYPNLPETAHHYQDKGALINVAFLVSERLLSSAVVGMIEMLILVPGNSAAC